MKIDLCIGGYDGLEIENYLVNNSTLFKRDLFLEFNKNDAAPGIEIMDLMGSPDSYVLNLPRFKTAIVNPRGIAYKLSTRPNARFGFIDWEKAMPVPHDMSCVQNWVNQYGQRGLYLYSKALKNLVDLIDIEINKIRPFVFKLYGCCHLHHYAFSPKVSEHSQYVDRFKELFLDDNAPFAWMNKYACQHFTPHNKGITITEITNWINGYFNTQLKYNDPCFIVGFRYGDNSDYIRPEHAVNILQLLLEKITDHSSLVLWGNAQQGTASITKSTMLESWRI